MVALIASISFIGYFTMMIAGPGKDVILIALTAGVRITPIREFVDE